MTKENFDKLDKTKDIYCECCKQYKPVSSFMYRNIKASGHNANRCKTCDWFYRNYNGNIPIIDNFSRLEIIETVRFILEDDNIYINTLAANLNKEIPDLISLIYKLNIKNMPIKVKSNCTSCGKEIANNISVYLTKKNLYCSQECYWKDKTNQLEHGENSPFYNRIETTCTNCGKVIKVIPSEFNTTNHLGDNHNFCCIECYWQYRSKYYINEKASMYQYKFTEIQKERSRIAMVNNLYKSDRLETSIQKIIDDLLIKNNIEFIREKAFDYYAVDNYLPEYNAIIEVMGDYWHTSPLIYNESKYQINDLQQKQLHRDKQKYSYIMNHYNIPILYLWETDIKKNPRLCISLIKQYIKNNCILPNYHSFNWELENDNLLLKENIVIPYQSMSVNKYRHLIKKKVG
nr:MAG TPA: DNA mismatch endonuclease [Caudoviricetes sp.]